MANILLLQIRKGSPRQGKMLPATMLRTVWVLFSLVADGWGKSKDSNCIKILLTR